MRITWPTVLTLLRIVLIPVMVALFYVGTDAARWAALAVFIIAALTDWFDGWLARRLGQTTAFGAFLDPVADKLLVCAALVLLLDLQRVDALVAVIIVGREIAISALREWMAGMGARRSVAVHSIGKLKTVAQLVAIPMLLYHQPLFGVVPVQRIGTWLIWVAALLTLWSMFYYLRQAWPLLRDAS